MWILNIEYASYHDQYYRLYRILLNVKTQQGPSVSVTVKSYVLSLSLHFSERRIHTTAFTPEIPFKLPSLSLSLSGSTFFSSFILTQKENKMFRFTKVRF